MRRLVLMMSLSLDGYLSDPHGGLDWQSVDAEVHRHFNATLRTAGAFIDGRVTYELMAGYWPTADADPAASPELADFAAIWRAMPKVVYSRTLASAGWNSEIRREIDPEEIRAMKAQPGGDLVLGGGVLGRAMMALGLVDEYRIYVHPAVLGDGVRLFGETPVRLRLAESTAFGNGVVLLRYLAQ